MSTKGAKRGLNLFCAIWAIVTINQMGHFKVHMQISPCVEHHVCKKRPTFVLGYLGYICYFTSGPKGQRCRIIAWSGPHPYAVWAVKCLIILKCWPTSVGFLLFLLQACPKTLMSQTRLTIRRHLSVSDKEPAIDSLDIPLILRNYLKHDTTELIWCLWDMASELFTS